MGSPGDTRLHYARGGGATTPPPFSACHLEIVELAPKNIYSRGHCTGMVDIEFMAERVAKLEVQVAELAVCCKSCTNRLDKLEN